MSYRSLRDFISYLEAAGELQRVTAPVSPKLEMTEIQTRLLAEGGPAVLFESPTRADGTPYDIPVLANLFGTVRRVALGMGREPQELRAVGETLAFLRQPEPPGGWRDAVGMMPLVKTAMAMRPRTVRDGPVQEVMLKGEDIDLGALPIQTCWPDEPAPLITWPVVVTQGPGDDPGDAANLGVYRMQVEGRDRTLMRWLRHRGGAQHHTRWKEEKQEPLPVAVVIGADPATLLAAVTPVPDTLSEYQFAGLLRGKKLELVPCKTVPLEVPASAEIVIEGEILTDTHEPEGPFGGVTGHAAYLHVGPGEDLLGRGAVPPGPRQGQAQRRRDRVVVDRRQRTQASTAETHERLVQALGRGRLRRHRNPGKRAHQHALGRVAREAGVDQHQR